MDLEAILSLLGILGTPQRVLLELMTRGPQSGTFLAQKLSLPRPSVYDALHTLEKKDLIISQEENGKSIFSAKNPKTILQLMDDSKEELEKAQKDFSAYIPDLLKSPRITEPKIKMFSGKDGCQQTMRDILWYKDIETYTLWPMDKMISVLTPEFLEWHKNNLDNFK